MSFYGQKRTTTQWYLTSGHELCYRDTPIPAPGLICRVTLLTLFKLTFWPFIIFPPVEQKLKMQVKEQLVEPVRVIVILLYRKCVLIVLMNPLHIIFFRRKKKLQLQASQIRRCKNRRTTVKRKCCYVINVRFIRKWSSCKYYAIQLIFTGKKTL